MSAGREPDSGASRFRTTAWSVVAAAQDTQSPAYQESLAYLCKMYWKPIYRYVRRRGFSADMAGDLTQDYFETFLEKGFVEAADRERGKFRTFMLTTVTRFLSKQYRKLKPPAPHVPLQIEIDEERQVTREELADDHTAEDEFNRSWARSLIDRTLERMEETCAEGKQRLYHRVFRTYIESATETRPKSYRQIGELYGLSEMDVTNYLHRGRNIFQKLLREEVRHSVLTDAEVDQEIEELRQYFV
jgi:RNA polymerase sigma-70 factor (ECF subfamily)